MNEVILHGREKQAMIRFSPWLYFMSHSDLVVTFLCNYVLIGKVIFKSVCLASVPRTLESLVKQPALVAREENIKQPEKM